MATSALVFSQSPIVGQANLVFGLQDGQDVRPTTELVFYQSAATYPAELVFGDDGDADTQPLNASVVIRATLSPLSGRVRLAAGLPVSVRAVLPLLRGRVPMRYATDTSRPTVGSVRSRWQDASPVQTGQRHRWQDALKLDALTASRWQDAAPTRTQVASRWQEADSIRVTTLTHWQDAAKLRQSTEALFQEALRSERASATTWQNADKLHQAAAVRFQEALRDRRASVDARWQDARRLQNAVSDSAQPSVPVYSSWSARWQNAMQPGIAQVITPPVVGERCYTPNPHLLFALPWPASPALLFYCDRDQPSSGPDPFVTLYILPARFYMTTHNLVAHRLPDMAPVPLDDATLSADVGSFAWQFSATGPDSLLGQLAPLASGSTAIPQQLQITLNGSTWVFVVESLRRTHTFGKRTVSISGRSATALVGAPFRRELAYTNTNVANAQQLAAQALDLTGLALEWGITDWLVPANAWSTTGTPLAVVQAIAQAAGGYLQSHRSAATLQVRHPYPPRPDGSSGGPWNWATGSADVVLAPDAIITNAIDRRDGPDINAIYVSGTTQGVLALVKRAGTAGDKLAPQETDALITDASAAQQRGLATLGKAGPQYAVSLELPVLSGVGQPGVIDVGQLVQVNESTPWRGRVRSVSVNAAMPIARQTITLERHL